MNLPNKLTVARAVLVPFFLAALLITAIPYNYLWACIIFTVASFTDFLDGKIARSRNMVTTFGKFLDPLADKILVTAALVAFVELGLASSVAVVIIIGRDLMVSGIRMVAVSSDGKVIAANWWGKIKTAMQMITIIAVLVAAHFCTGDAAAFDAVKYWSGITMWAVAAFTLISGLVYVFQNKKLINTFK